MILRLPRTLTRTLPLIALLMLLAIGGATDAAAAGKRVGVKITSPVAGAKVSGDFTIHARVSPAQRRHSVSYYVDGQLIARRHGGRAAGASRNMRVNAARLSGGRHTIRVTVRAGRKKASSRVSVVVPKATESPAKQAPAGTPEPAPAETPQAPPAIPDQPTVPAADAADFQLIFADDFTKDAAQGSFASDCDAGKIVYTGAGGTKWRAYPKCYKDTYQKRPYRSDKVLSVHDGSLDFWLHSVDGQPAGANPSPVINGDSQYQTYGRYSARVKIDGELPEYYMAWLLWPYNEGAWQSAESDFPERSLGSGNGVSGYHHSSAGQEGFGRGDIDIRQWHTYTQDWTPLVRRYYVDGHLIHTTLNPVYQAPQRWQLQTETNGNGNSDGHLLVDWVAVYSYAPGTQPG